MKKILDRICDAGFVAILNNIAKELQ